MSFSVQNFNIHKYGQKFCLDDVVSQCNLSINPKEYIHKVTPKTLFNGNYYVTKTKLISILEKAKAIESKKLLELIKNNKDVKSTDLTDSIEQSETNQPNKNKSTQSTQLTVKKPINFVDSGKNVIYFNSNQVKYFYLKEQIYFKAKDVANILAYANSKDAIMNNVESFDKISIKNIFEGGRFQLPPKKSNEYIKFNSLFGNEDPKTIFINESGLYSLILGSKKPEAKQFKHWVTSEVLPSIRKYGSYSLTNGNEYSIDKLDKFTDCDVIYLLNVKDNLYKFGTSFTIKERLKTHANNLAYNHIVKIYKVSNRNIGLKCEDKIKKLAKKLKMNICYNNGIEFFETNNKYSIQDMINNIKEIIDETEIEYKQKNYTVPVPIDHLIELNKLIETIFNGCTNIITQQKQICNTNKDIELKIKELEINQKHQNLMEEKKMHYQVKLKELDLEMMKIKL
jgi:prophage antirepressor-like protein